MLNNVLKYRKDRFQENDYGFEEDDEDWYS